MEQVQSAWKKTVSSLITAFIVYSLATLAGEILDVINNLFAGVDILSTIYELLNGYYEPGTMDIIGALVNILVIVGYLIFLSKLSEFSNLQKTYQDKQDVSKVRSGYVLMVISAIIDFIPVLGGIIAAILYVLSYALLISGFKALSRSLTMHPDAKEGFDGLRSCTVCLLIGSILSILPLIGDIINGLITIWAFFAIKDNWNTVGEHEPIAAGTSDQPVELPASAISSHEYDRLKEIEEAEKLRKEEERKVAEERRIAWWKKWGAAVAAAAVALVAVLIVLQVTSGSSRYDRATSLYAAGKLDKALRVLEKIKPSSHLYPEAQYDIYTLKMHQNDTSEAAQALINAATSNRHLIYPYILQTYAAAMINGSLEPHITKDLNKGIDILYNANDYESKLLAGEECFKSGENYDKAYEIFCHTMKYSESTGMEDGYIGLMYLYGLNGFKKDYEKAYNSLLMAPEDPLFTVHKGDLALYLYNDHQKAKGFYEIANSLSGEDSSIRNRMEAIEKYLQNHSSEKRYWAKANSFSCTHENAGIKITQNYNIHVGTFADGTLSEGTHITPDGKRYVGKFDSLIGLYNGIVYDIHGNIIERLSMSEEEHRRVHEEKQKEVERKRAERTFKVGEYHDWINGVIIYLDDTMKHGVAMTLGYRKGKAEGWEESLGNGWRLPTATEISYIYKNGKAINSTLEKLSNGKTFSYSIRFQGNDGYFYNHLGKKGSYSSGDYTRLVKDF